MNIPQGANFYVEPPEKLFTYRVNSWINHLGISHLFPNLNSLTDRIREISSQMRSIGDKTVSGCVDNGRVLIRPGDYATLLYLLAGANPSLKGTLLATPSGSYAFEAFVAGDYEGTLDRLLSSDRFSSAEKLSGRVVAEASMVLGRHIFELLARFPVDLNSPAALTNSLREAIGNYEQQSLTSQHSEIDYLIAVHGLTEPVAQYLITLTGDTKETIFKSTAQAKKDVIGAFKALASFYHVNLGHSLDEAIAKTEGHFERNEALTIHKTLMIGAKEAFAKLVEYGYPLEVCRYLSEKMISYGATRARLYAAGIPPMLEVTGQFGPNGSIALARTIQKSYLFDSLTLTDGSRGLLKLLSTEPELVPLVLDELTKLAWDAPPTIDGYKDMDWLLKMYPDAFVNLNQIDKALLLALSFYHAVYPKKLYGYSHIGFTVDEVYKDHIKKSKEITTASPDSKSLSKRGVLSSIRKLLKGS